MSLAVPNPVWRFPLIDAVRRVSYSTGFSYEWYDGGKQMGSGEHQFEPMTVGMILDRAFRLYSENFPLMFGITAVFNLPLIVIQAIPTFLINRRDSPLPIVAALVSLLISLLT